MPIRHAEAYVRRAVDIGAAPHLPGIAWSCQHRVLVFYAGLSRSTDCWMSRCEHDSSGQ
jgi:hypothetical protein